MVKKDIDQKGKCGGGGDGGGREGLQQRPPWPSPSLQQRPTNLIRQTRNRSDLHLWPPPFCSPTLTWLSVAWSLETGPEQVRRRSYPLGRLSFILWAMMQFESNALIPHDPILKNKEEIKVWPGASPHFLYVSAVNEQSPCELQASVSAL